jgi:hypothetical protein
MARTMDGVEQIAVALLASAVPMRPTVQAWVAQIVNSIEYAEYDASVDREMRQDIREFAVVTRDEDAVEMQMADHRIAGLAHAVIEHRHGNGYARTQLPQVRLAAIDTENLTLPKGLGASIVEYTASISESAARLAEHLEDAR